MLLVVPLVLVLVAVLGAAIVAGARAGEAPLVPGGFLLVAVVGVLVTGVVVAAVAVGGTSGREDGSAAVSGIEPRPRSRPAGPPRPGPVVTMVPEDPDAFPSAARVVDRLKSDSVLRLEITGFEPFATAVVQQCAPTLALPCGNTFPVQFGEDGAAEVQYLVTDRFLGRLGPQGECGPRGPVCTVVVRSLESEIRAEVQTVFGAAAGRPGRIVVTPSSGLAFDGQKVLVEVEGFPAGSLVRATVCGVPDAFGPRCGPPAPTAPIRVGPDGRGRTRLRVEPGLAGVAGAPCGRGDVCGVSVFSNEVFARAPVVPISFSQPAGAAYDARRLLAALAVAALLLLTALIVLRRSDWSAVGEAAAPEIDDAEYADLDAIVAALPPEDEPAGV